MKRKRIGEMLVEVGLITREQLDEAVALQQSGKSQRLGEILVEKGFITDQQLLETLEFVLGIPRIELSKVKIDSEAINLLPASLSRKHRILPISAKNGRITLAMIDPLNYEAIDDVRIYTGLDVVPVIASEREMEVAIQQNYALRFDPKVEHILGELKKTKKDPDKEQAAESIVIEDDAPIIRMVNSLLQQAVQSRASDIHIEPQPSHVRVRFRIDGDLFEVLNLPKQSFPALVSRLKIIGNLDISEKRLPQDGRTKMVVDGREIDFRMSSLPSILGEKIVLRILDSSNARLGIEELGFSPYNMAIIESLLKLPHGMLLVTGPTGSGKTTTMYSILNRINSVNRNVITLEDPVEYTLAGINQVQINPRAGLTFALGLRFILRQDPDVIMVGEMRDYETAELGVRAALTGHLILSTLHTNSAAGTITRILDMGIQKYLLSSSLAGIIAQRLVRRLCPECKTAYLLDEVEAHALGIPEYSGKQFYRNQGCQICRNTGYVGRLALHEILVIDPEMRAAINREGGVEHILEEVALRQGMVDMKKDGLEKAAQGLTSIEEVMKAVYLGG